jgi:hypothetical protein
MPEQVARFEDHAMGLSHHDATHNRAKIKYHAYGRNCRLLDSLFAICVDTG